MKLIKSVKHGTKPISKIYLNNQIIYEKVCVHVLIASKSIIDTILTGSPETVYGCLTSVLKATVDTESVAFLETTPIADATLTGSLNMKSIVVPDLVAPYDSAGAGDIEIDSTSYPELANVALVRLHTTENILSSASPNAVGQVDSSSITKISISDISGAHSAPIVYGSVADKINYKIVGSAKSVPVVTANGKGGVVGIADMASASSVVEVEASMHGGISMASKFAFNDVPQVFGDGHDVVDVEMRLITDNIQHIDLASHNALSLYELSVADNKVVTAADAHGDISDVTNLAEMIIWQYPKNTGDYWLIVQAYEANKINDETLEVI